MMCCLLAQTAAAAPSSGQDLRIEGIRYGLNAGKTRIVVDLNRATDFRAFLLEKPDRIVVDVPAASWTTQRARPLQGQTLKGYRSGDLPEGVTRIIFDLRRTAVITNAFTLKKSGLAKDRLVIDLSPATRNFYTARLDDVFGKRDLRGRASASFRSADSEFRQMQNRMVAETETPFAAAQALPVPKPFRNKRGQAADRRYTIIIDPGHGGEDPGAVGPGAIREKAITLATAKELKRQLEETGRYKVYLTREQDSFIRLRERVSFSRRKGGELFISIHADKIGRKNVRGASIYTLSEKASDAETARLADAENRAGVVAGVDLSEESADVADILLDLAMREKMNESNLLARFLAQSLEHKKIRLLPNSHRSAGFAVLKAPDIPSVLIEIGFLSNNDEAKLLTSSQFHKKISGAIVEGVNAYFRKIETLERI